MIEDTEKETLVGLVSSGALAEPRFFEDLGGLADAYLALQADDHEKASRSLIGCLEEGDVTAILRPSFLLLIGCCEGLRGEAAKAMDYWRETRADAACTIELKAITTIALAEAMNHTTEREKALAELVTLQALGEYGVELKKHAVYLQYGIYHALKRTAEQTAAMQTYLALDGFTESADLKTKRKVFREATRGEPKFDNKRLGVVVLRAKKEVEKRIWLSDEYSSEDPSGSDAVDWLSSCTNDQVAVLARQLPTDRQIALSEEFRRAGAFSKLREVLDMEPGAVAPEDEVEVLNEHLAKLHEQKKFGPTSNLDADQLKREEVRDLLCDYRDAVSGQFYTRMKRTGESVAVSLSCGMHEGEKVFLLNRSGGKRSSLGKSAPIPFLELRIPSSCP